MNGKLPLITMVTACVFLICGVILVILSRPEQQPSTLIVLGLIVSAVPGLIAASFAERTNRDIRNGTVVEKAREGAVKALQQTGVTNAIEQNVPVTNAALLALAKLIELNTTATQDNTTAHNTQEGGDNGRQNV